MNEFFADPTPWYASSTFITAVVGLTGVVVGGLITGGFSYLTERRREIRDEKKESQLRAVELKRAIRLVEIELVYAHSAFDQAIRTGKWWPSKVATPTQEKWKEFQGVLSTELPDNDWRTVTIAILGIGHGVMFREFDSDQKGVDRDFPDLQSSSQSIVAGIVKDMDEGLGVLKKYNH